VGKGTAARCELAVYTAARVRHGGATKATAPRLTGGVDNGGVRMVRRSAARHERLNGAGAVKMDVAGR
jgi:hypothetical protein